MVALSGSKSDRLQAALNFSSYTAGKTHNFYHYPARFSPEFAHTVISEFSNDDDWVMDPFMGGGTSIIEGLALRRRLIGVDLNALAHFIAATRTTPMSKWDQELLHAWAARTANLLSDRTPKWVNPPSVYNLPDSIKTFSAGALVLASKLPFERHRAFARCALLRLGQWALEGREHRVPRRKRLGRQLRYLVASMLEGMEEFVAHCQAAGVPKHQITSRRVLLNRDAAGLDEEPLLSGLQKKVKLVVTSPPYPGVHVLYHRWQHRSRKETPAPYWIANVSDGCGESFYTFGNRKRFTDQPGMALYAGRLTATFRSLHPYLARNALVFQLVAFPCADRQLPAYLDAMEAAGYKEITVRRSARYRLARRVPNRRWYARNQGGLGAASELLLIHRRG